MYCVKYAWSIDFTLKCPRNKITCCIIHIFPWIIYTRSSLICCLSQFRPIFSSLCRFCISQLELSEDAESLKDEWLWQRQTWKMQLPVSHRCTVVGNSGGGGSWGYLGVVRKSRWRPLFSCFIAFLRDNFSDLTPFPPEFNSQLVVA